MWRQVALYPRRMVSWVFSPKPDADLVIKPLDTAYEQRRRAQSVLFHIDQSRSFRKRGALENRMDTSVGSWPHRLPTGTTKTFDTARSKRRDPII